MEKAVRKSRGSFWWKLKRVIGENDTRTRAIPAADGMVTVLNRTDVEAVLLVEIGYGVDLGSPVADYRGDFRLAADNEGSVMNLQVGF